MTRSSSRIEVQCRHVLRERPERRGYLLPAPQGLPQMSSLMSSLSSRSTIASSSLLSLTTNKKVQKKGVKSKEGGKKSGSIGPTGVWRWMAFGPELNCFRVSPSSSRILPACCGEMPTACGSSDGTYNSTFNRGSPRHTYTDPQSGSPPRTEGTYSRAPTPPGVGCVRGCPVRWSGPMSLRVGGVGHGVGRASLPGGKFWAAPSGPKGGPPV